ncbi:hypothetical protein ABC628_08265 [Lentilactobacillus otakiensis]|uniref:Uncharacterized protein n=1 Tax=Lentilactobacillus otakiensis DSM 19908 = JCM 15040 TaxID=1423780 RepID=S4PQX0_9LACO|nr:hypothetical protein [Lentilactobacillus otakiensis]KRL09951.1 hypothetical protein FD05_GL000939 [Lentilactobacillus otakiensis DSM 19908 = JCM 15040]MBZ3776277.1 hypothetical protein [Lentilactobacillus otakiensis]MDV3517299.1 hypothetical protein [Lentilactobacillus otakiensis]GAD17570.1 hypothetical protein LOT_2108 [Lentilactobacillus otakiensis DSM 19908 = JCM 15040]
MSDTINEGDKTKLSKWRNLYGTQISSNNPGNIHELFAGWKVDGEHDNEIDWGESKGNELKW